MIEQKYKVWHKGNKAWYKDDYSLDYEECDGTLNILPLRENGIDNVLHFLQYTGIDDKNGVEIYDGWIIEMLGNNCLVKRVGACFVAQIIGDIGERYYLLLGTFDIEVIGNMYDTPQLLEVKR